MDREYLREADLIVCLFSTVHGGRNASFSFNIALQVALNAHKVDSQLSVLLCGVNFSPYESDEFEWEKEDVENAERVCDQLGYDIVFLDIYKKNDFKKVTRRIAKQLFYEM
jgi:hypothetical protein